MQRRWDFGGRARFGFQKGFQAQQGPFGPKPRIASLQQFLQVGLQAMVIMAGLLDSRQWAEHQQFGAHFGGFEAFLTELLEEVFGVVGPYFLPALGV